MNYQVIVGNVGTVYDGDNRKEAEDAYADYVDFSKALMGRVGGEAVTLFCDGEILLEHPGEP